MALRSNTSDVQPDSVDDGAAARPLVRLRPSRTFRPTGRPDARVVLGAGLALLSLAALGIGLSQELPGTQGCFGSHTTCRPTRSCSLTTSAKCG
jgi:hypothetical protein